MESEKAYWNHEIAKLLGIGESTLRKWCIELEKNGYTFLKGTKDSRAFTQHDLNAITTFKNLTKVKKFTMSQAAKQVVERYGEREEQDRTTPVPYENTQSLSVLNESLSRLVEELEIQRNQNLQMAEIIARATNIIEKQGESLDLLQEEKKVLLETVERSNEVLTEIEESKKKRMSELFLNFFRKSD